ncbi:MAG: carboxypeptidase regulatory-like domain-containing protein [Methanobacteriota archaeon]
MKSSLLTIILILMLMCVFLQNIPVKAEDEQLQAWFPPIVVENTNALIFVTDIYDDGLEGATTIFGWNQEYTTTTYGFVEFTTPEVTHDYERYSVCIEKEGFTPECYINQQGIQVYNSQVVSPNDLLRIDALPYALSEGTLDVHVTSNGHPVQDAQLLVNWSPPSQFPSTNHEGAVTLYLPLVTRTTNYTYMAYKDGKFPDTKQVRVYANTPQLTVIAPSSVTEANTFIVKATVDEFPVAGAIISFYNNVKFTDENGLAIFTAPSVDANTDLIIQASKEGFLSTETYIQIQNTINPGPGPIDPTRLVLSAPDSVDENTTFFVFVTANSLPVSSAYITFNETFQYTGSNGRVQFTAPLVTQDTDYMITASKPGYLNTSISITVKNTITLAQLSIHAPPVVYEEQNFIVTITTNNTPVSNASVIFNTMRKNTTEQGTVVFQAPQVNTSQEFTIHATKPGYDDAITVIIVVNIPSTNTTIPLSCIYGVVTDTLGNIIPDATICITPSSNTDDCTKTTAQGRYIFCLPIGSYSFSATKEGYATSVFYDVLLSEDSVQEINFKLRQIRKTSEVYEESYDPGKITIDWGIENGFIDANLIVSATGRSQSYLFMKNLSITISPSNKGEFSFSVDGPENVRGIFIAIQLNDVPTFLNTTIVNVSTIQLLYDEEKIPIASSFTDFFNNPDNNDTPLWCAVITNKNLTILLRIPHFSQHHILIHTIEQVVVESFGGIAALILYITIIVLVLILLAFPIRFVKKY